MKIKNNLRALIVVLIAFSIQAISCRKNDFESSAINKSSTTVANLSLVNEAKKIMQPIISADSYNDLDWANASVDTRGNGAILLVVNSKSTPGESLFYLKSNPAMYIWQNETHFLSN